MNRGAIIAIGIVLLLIVGAIAYVLISQSKKNTPPVTQKCKVSDWSDWSLCDKPCGGGKQKRTRTIITPGSDCPALFELRDCNSIPCVALECKVSEWGPWSECSTKCGKGNQIRERSVTQSGPDCPELTEHRDCIIEECPTDCVIGEWTDWTNCSRPCGGGVKTRTRDVKTPPVGHGMECPSTEDVVACNTQQCPVDCVVGDYSDWSECSKTCGGGVHHRSRTIVTEPTPDGKQCPDLHLEEPCNTQECYRDCKVGDWGAWSDCSKSCGGGTRERTRPVLESTIGRGLACPETSQVVPCGNQTCDQDCVVSDWSAWSVCSEVCGGGSQSRTRSIILPSIGNGKVCPNLIEYQNCNSLPCPGDCEVSEWSNWSNCNKPCGGGMMERTRNVTRQPTPGGFPCPSVSEHRQCNIQECPVDCKVSNWSNWTECSQACGGGTKLRTRTVLQYPNSTGLSCPPLIETLECNNTPCTVSDCTVSDWGPWTPCVGCGDELKTHERTILSPGTGHNCPPTKESAPCDNKGCPIDCQVSEYSDWSECSVLCGGGKQHRDRFIVRQPENGGQTCPPLQEVHDCNTLDCPVDCQLGKWSEWGACNKPCGGGVSIRTRDIVTPPAFGGSNCGSTQEVQPCNTQACPVDCSVSDWSNWSECDKPCGNGNQIRTRSIITQPHDGGKACPPLQENHECNTFECPVDCSVSNWSEWDACTKPCGGGVTTRHRDVIVQPAHGGIGCPAVMDSLPCNTQVCDIDCAVSEWSPWSECDKQCETGHQHRVRNITTYPAANGKACPPLDEARECNTQKCPTDCVVGDWSNWSECSATCGGGTKSRRRDVLVNPQFGGITCPITEDIQLCNTLACDRRIEVRQNSLLLQAYCWKGSNPICSTYQLQLKPSFMPKSYEGLSSVFYETGDHKIYTIIEGGPKIYIAKPDTNYWTSTNPNEATQVLITPISVAGKTKYTISIGSSYLVAAPEAVNYPVWRPLPFAGITPENMIDVA